MANEYVTSAELKATLSLTGETYADADVAVAVEAASRTIDRLCGTQFFAGAPGEVRKYTPTNPWVVAVDDVRTITAVVSDGVTLVRDTDYVEDGDPVRTLRALRWGVFRPCVVGSRFASPAVNSVSVTGTYGWAAVPLEVKQATTLLAARLLKRAREAPFAVTGLEFDAGAIRIARTDPDVKTEIAPYVRHPAAA